MSIVRLSVIDDTVYAPTAGALKPKPADDPATKPQYEDRLDQFPFAERTLATETSEFRAYLARAVAKLDPRTADQPVVILVHGFWYDPTDPIDEDSQDGNNPHARNFHFAPPPDPGSLRDFTQTDHWRHTSSWPLGLGFKKEDDGGAGGLAVAFGWDSTPTALRSRGRGREAWVAALNTVLEKLSAGGAAGDDIQANLRRAGVEMAKLVGPKSLLSPLSPVNLQVARLTAALTKAATLKKDSSDDLKEEIGKSMTTLGKASVPLVEVFLKHAPELYAQAYNRAVPAGWVLANTIRVLAQTTTRPIHLFCHSLGSRVVCQALDQMAGKRLPELRRVGKIIVVGGAEYNEEAREMLCRVESATGAAPSVYNFMGRRDRVLSQIAGEYHPTSPKPKRPIGCFGLQGVLDQHPHWIDLQLDSVGNDHALNRWYSARKGAEKKLSGAPLGEKAEAALASAHVYGVLNHWYYFTNAANMELYRDILRDTTGAWAIDRLREEGIPENQTGFK